ncbi:ModE family transcriptional regulator [Croceicoccus estronivorus]|uniref:winged helix-turn-helix domain-containing protein n=1 Tax=Croceicoccus estronivorus TaxID=1172626 RepID=UPI00082EA500|nr:LysR family transcriptional regulator [Croceicoccus estronivorus]OCC22386.1 ModE family transcriptional regulator [Croceicoccus estronivorus]
MNTLKIKIQIMCGDEIAMGPGKADLLDSIGKEGSISAAGRALGMSYRRTWMLVDVMNRCWCEPLVSTMPSGSARSGARVTSFGHEVLQHYRMLQKQAGRIENGADWAALECNLLPAPLEQQRS